MSELVKLVVDTNFLLDHLDIIQELTILGPKCHFENIIPVQVTSELDGIKSKPGPAGLKARTAIKWIFEQLANSRPGIRGQKLLEHIDANLRGDDAIIDCCRYFSQSVLTVLISNDRNICARALTDGIRTVTYQNGITAKQIAMHVVRESGVMILDLEDLMPDGTAANADEDIEMDYGDFDFPEPTMPEVQGLRQKEYSSVGAFERDIQTTLLENASALVDFRIRETLDLAFLTYSKYTKPIADASVLSQFILKHQIDTFVDFLPREVLGKLNRSRRTASSRSEIDEFIDLWGAVIVHLSGRDPKFVALVTSVQNAFKRFYTAEPRT